jgi:hypothetical protein
VTFRFLVSFHYHQRTNLQEIVDAYNGPCEVFADSGAFSAATQNVTINLKDYTAWLKDWEHLLTVKATLDVIGDPEATARNTRTLERQGIGVLPVFHVGTPWEELEALVKQYDYMALGGMVPHNTNPEAVMRWMVKAFRIARETGTVFHGFGQTRLASLKSLPFYSVDSSAWSSGMRYGTIVLWDEKRNGFVKIQGGNASDARRYAALLRSHGADPGLVAKSGFAMNSRRTPAQFRKEVSMMRGAPAIAYMRMGQYLAQRHKVPRPGSLGEGRDGTSMYVADVALRHLIDAAPLVNSHGTNVYLAADQGGGCLVDALDHMRGPDGGEGELVKRANDPKPPAAPGTVIYLANSEQINIKGAAKTLSGVKAEDIGGSIYAGARTTDQEPA